MDEYVGIMILEGQKEFKLDNLDAANESSESESNAFAFSNSRGEKTAGRLIEMKGGRYTEMMAETPDSAFFAAVEGFNVPRDMLGSPARIARQLFKQDENSQK